MSIRARLVMILVSLVVLALFLALVRGYQKSMSQAQLLLDAELSNLAQAIMSLPIEETEHLGESPLLYQVWREGRAIAASHRLIETPFPETKQTGYTTLNAAGQRLRVYSLVEGNKVVQVAEPTQKQFALVEAVILSAMMPLLWSVPILALLISLVVKNAVDPLSRLARLLQHKRANDFSEIEALSSDREIKTVVHRLNDLFKRVEGAYLRERYFASDAAHELRTPLSSMKINLHNIQGSCPGPDTDALRQGIDRMSQIVEQMLLLGRTHPEQWHSQFEEQDLLAISQQVVVDLYDKIAQKQQDISIEGEEGRLEGDAFTLATLVKNLVSNAVKYTPNGGTIKISLSRENKALCWQIDDSGAGIAEADRERVYDRFFRVGGDRHPSGETGAGLGMAIVKHITDIYSADIRLAESPLGGLQVRVCFSPREKE